MLAELKDLLRDKWELKLRADDQIFRAFGLVNRLKQRFDKGLQRLAAPNAKLKGRHAGERCFILGTSPSIGEQDLAALKDEHTIGVNFFFLHPQAAEVSADYWVVADHKMVDGGWPLEHVGGDSYPDGMLKRMDAVAPGSEYFFMASTAGSQALQAGLRGHQTHWLIGGESFHWGATAPIDLTGPVPAVNVMQFAMHIAYYMGFSKIHLLGISLDGLPRDLLGLPSHFYGGPPENRELRLDKVERDLILSGFGIRQWRAMAEYYQRKDDVEIINCTPDGLLNLFPRMSLEQALARP